MASFLYDADGKQVKAVVGSTTTYYVGMHYQVDNGVITKYYLAGATRIAMRKGTTLYYLLSDHASTMLSTSLGSTSLTLNSSGSKIAELRYRAWGETRYREAPCKGTSGTTPTTYQFTSQRNETSLGLYFYNARWYDPSLGRFTSADTVVPAGAQGYDRYAYANNNPVKYVDPSGHDPWYCETATCERKYSNRFSTKTVDTPLRENDEGSSILEISDILEDKADAIRNSFPMKTANDLIETAIGLFAGAGCGESPICAFVTGYAANAVGSDIITSPTAEAYDDVAEILEEAAKDEDTIYKDTVQVRLTPLAATGTLVSVDEYGCQTLNPDFHEQECALTVEGASSSVILTPSQAEYINTLFGGGWLP